MSRNPVDLRPYLAAGERILWTGQPRQGLVFRAIDIFLIPFSLIWCGGVLVWEYLALFGMGGSNHNSPPLFFALFGLMFVVVGLYFAFGRFIADRHYRSKLTYGITNDRVITKSDAWRQTLSSQDLTSIQGLRLVEHDGGRGTIHLSESSSLFANNGLGFWHAVLGQPPMLFQVEDARRVFDLIREQRKP